MRHSDYPRWWPRRKVIETSQQSTLHEAENALQQSQSEKKIVFRLRPRVERAVHEAKAELETNHLAELFRPAFRGGSR